MSTALVTGASSGLGASILYLLRNEGWLAQGTCLNPIVDECPDLIAFNACDPDREIPYLMSELQRLNTSRLDLLVNCAGINQLVPFNSLTRSSIERIMTANFLTPVLLAREIHSSMSRGGIICNIVSDASYKPMRHSLAYNCSKAALAMATKQMARELTKTTGLTIFSVNPGKMAGTQMSKLIDREVCAIRNWTPKQAAEYFRNSSVTGEESNPYHVAVHVVNLILGIGPSSMLSGACIDLVG